MEVGIAIVGIIAAAVLILRELNRRARLRRRIKVATTWGDEVRVRRDLQSLEGLSELLVENGAIQRAEDQR